MGNRTLVDVASPGIRSVDGGDQTALLTGTLGGTTLNIKGGTGRVIDQTNILDGIAQTKIITWEDENNINITPFLPSPTGNFAVIKDGNGITDIIDAGQSTTLLSPNDFNDNVQLGNIVTIGGLLAQITVLAMPTYGVGSAFYSLMRVLGKKNSKSNPFSVEPRASTSSINLQMQGNPGESFNAGGGYKFDVNTPHYNEITVTQAPLIISLAKRDSTFAFSPTAELDPNQFEDPVGTLNPVPVNQFTLQHLYLFANIAILGVIYGNETFPILSQAVNSLVTPPFIPIGATSMWVGSLGIRQGITNFSNPATFQFIDPGLYTFI